MRNQLPPNRYRELGPRTRVEVDALINTLASHRGFGDRELAEEIYAFGVGPLQERLRAWLNR